MGKDNKKKKGQPDHMAWMDSMMGKNRDIEERYGVAPVRFGGKPGESGQLEAHQHMKDYKDKLVEGFRNDYDARRTLEASAMSGKKKAQDILDSGFKSVSDIRNAQNFFEKAAKRHGQGGQFSNASDFMGLTQSMVERDRRINNEQFVTRDEFEQAQKKEASEGDNKELKDIVLSDHMQKAKERVDEWEGGNPPVPIFAEGLEIQAKGRPAVQLNKDIDINNLTDPMNFLENRIQKVIDEYEMEPEIQ